MSEPRWDEVARLFDAALGMDVDERALFLAQECGEDAALRAEVEAMLGAEEREGFLETPLDGAPQRGGSLVGTRVGGFEVLRLLGEGGMGAVYEAQQEHPRRRVALKVLRSALATRSVRRRFEVESELLGRLQHPNVAQVHEAGVHLLPGGFELPWFAMEYVEGGRHLTRHAEEERLDLRARLALVVDVCDAIAAAHRRGILHRDLKPSNLLVDREGRVKVIDFGVARAAGDDATMTRTGELIGTPSYMSPEQLSGRPEEVDAQSDVWALGVVLYRLVTGELPFETKDVPITELARRLERPPPAVSERSPVAPRDLDWVVERALEPDRTRRYGSVSELGDELRRLLADEPVLAVPASRLYRLRKFARRNRLLVGAGVGIAGALLVGTVLATVGLLRARDAERAAKLDAVAAREEASKFAGINGVLSSMFTSVDASAQGVDVRAIDLLDASAASLAEELADQPRVRKALHLVLAESYESLLASDETFAQAEEVLAIGRAEGALDEEDELVALALSASALLRLGDLEEARERVDQGDALAAALGFEGTDAHDRLRVVGVRILLRERALDEGRARVDALLAEFGAREEPPLAWLHEAGELRASLSYERGEFERAVEEYAALVERMRAEDARTMPRLRAELGHALALQRLDRHEEALRVLERVVPEVIEATGEASFDSRHAQNLAAASYMELGRPEVAELLLRSVLEASSGDEADYDHEAVKAQQRLGHVLAQRGKGAQATAELRQAARSAKEMFGPGHRYTASALTSLGIQLIANHEWDEAEQVLLQALDVRKAQADGDVVEKTQILARLGEVHFGRREWELAADHFEPAWRTFREHLGPTHHLTFMAGQNAIAAYTQLGRLEEALLLAEDLYRAMREHVPAADPGRLTQAGNLSVIHERLGHVPEAEAVLDEALRAARGAGGEERPEFVDLLYGRCRQLLARGEVEAALDAAEEGLALHREQGHQNRVGEAFLRVEYGGALRTAGRRQEAFDELVQAHRELVRFFPPDQPPVQGVVRSIAEVLDALGRTGEAERWRERLAER